MTNSQDEARRVLRIEAEAVAALAGRIGPSFDRAVEALLACRGRVVVMGMGKSGLIGRKIAATLASVGTPALFVHPAEGGHGDIGMLARGDCVLALSRSGETAELLAILPSLKRLGVPIVLLTGVPGSTMGRAADVALDVSVAEEACDMDLVPTASTTAALAMGDAIAVAVLKRRGLTPEDYARFHPAGALGRRLLLRVEDIMRSGAEVPRVGAGTSLREAILEMTAKKVGAACVVDAAGRLGGVLTDHDLRKALARDGTDVARVKVGDFMTVAPLAVPRDMLVAEAVRLTETRRVSVLPVVEGDGTLAGIVHLHDLLRAGVT
ncbi:MAG: KpsF/GutQ family sugar-phosphate isomerase [bacterium]